MEGDAAVKLPDLIVSATRTPQPRSEVAASTTVITAEDIRRSGRTHMEDLLREVPGVDFARRGGVGESGDFGIRGGSQGQTTILIDGVRVKDAGSSSGVPQIQNLMVDNIERIEVLRGPQSTLYGSDAITGVINIITKKGTEEPEVNAEFEAGSFSTSRLSAGARGRQGTFSYSLNATRFETAGIPRQGDDTESDGYENTALSGQFGWNPEGPARVNFSIHHNTGEKELGDNLREFEETFLRADVFVNKMEDVWHSNVGASYTETNRKFFEPRGPDGAPASRWDGEIWKVDYLGTVFATERQIFTFGIEIEEEIAEVIDSDGDSHVDDSFYTASGFGHHQFQATEDLRLSLGARALEHEDFGGRLTYQGSVLYEIPGTNTRFKANYATAFSAPSLAQLHDTRWGNPDLSPETSRGLDVGIEYELPESDALLGVTYFENWIDDLIEFEFAGFGPGGSIDGQFVNVEDAKTRGVETFADVQWARNVSTRASYTYQRAKDEATGNGLVRRPSHKFDIAVTYVPVDGTVLRVSTRFIGRRYNDRNNTERLGAYNVWDLSGSHRVTEHFELFGRIDNLLDEDYEEVRNFNTPGRAYFAGIRGRF